MSISLFVANKRKNDRLYNSNISSACSFLWPLMFPPFYLRVFHSRGLLMVIWEAVSWSKISFFIWSGNAGRIAGVNVSRGERASGGETSSDVMKQRQSKKSLRTSRQRLFDWCDSPMMPCPFAAVPVSLFAIADVQNGVTEDTQQSLDLSTSAPAAKIKILQLWFNCCHSQKGGQKTFIKQNLNNSENLSHNFKALKTFWTVDLGRRIFCSVRLTTSCFCCLIFWSFMVPSVPLLFCRKLM